MVHPVLLDDSRYYQVMDRSFGKIPLFSSVLEVQAEGRFVAGKVHLQAIRKRSSR